MTYWGRVLITFFFIFFINQTTCKRRHELKRANDNFIVEIFSTIGKIHKNIFSFETLKVLVGTLPFYIPTRVMDPHIHECFYDGVNHRNINQLHRTCKDISSHGIAIPILFLSSFALFSRDKELRETGRIFAIGMPFVLIGKDLIKTFEGDFCKRPKNELFDRCKIVYGGFPSGHMAEATYMAVLFGLRFGKIFALPLGAFAGFVAYSFLNCNRHYASQLVAGAALGTIYAIAGCKVVDSNLFKDKSISFNLEARPNGASFGITYEF